MSTWRVMLGTLLGMAPLCFLQAYFAEELFTRFPALIYPLVGACALYAAYAVWILARLNAAPAPSLEGAVSSEERT
jgi:threonine/homoserine/homoserine lactone efflux protein